MRPDRLYVVTRRDLSPIVKTVQLCHAAIQFCHEHSVRKWHDESNHLVILEVDAESGLETLLRRAKWEGVRVSPFREPDMGNRLTAVALEPGRTSSRLCRGIPLVR